jgi:hypothetical protein
VRRAGAAAQHRGDPGIERFFHLLRADEMDMRVDPAGRQDAPFARDDLGARPDRNGHARLRIGIARLADGMDAPVAQRHIGLDHAPMVQDHRIGDHGVRRALRPRDLALPHAVADHLAAAELHFLAIDGEILLHPDQQRGIAQADAVARGRAKHAGIGGAAHAHRHRHSAPITVPRNPMTTRAP